MRGIGDGPGECEDLLVDAELGQLAVFDVVEDRCAGSIGGFFAFGDLAVEFGFVADLDAAGGGVDRDVAARRPGVGVVVRQYLEQGVDVAGNGGQHDAAPGLVDADGSEPWVAGRGDLLQVQPGVGGGVELVKNLGAPLRDRLLQLGEVGDESLVDG